MLPIVLAHGYLGFGTLGPLVYFRQVAGIFTQLGAQDVYATNVNPKGGIEERSADLAAQIRQHVPTGQAHLIAHSMGGLDARYLIGRQNGRDMIATLTTLGTPFRGTLAADIAVHPEKLLGLNPAHLLESIARYELQVAAAWPFTSRAQAHFALAALRDAVARLAGGDYTHLAGYFRGLFTLNDQALAELTRESCARMFSDDRDLRGVPSCSHAGLVVPASVSPVLSVPALVLDAADQENDGVVPLNSAKLTNHKRTLPVDHLGLIGWTPADVSENYREIYETLAA
jgi:pimeloyl-ACP methyl ester carboxylesterase